MNVLLSATLGASQDSIGEHEELITVVSDVFTSQQHSKALNPLIIIVLLSKFII